MTSETASSASVQVINLDRLEFHRSNTKILFVGDSTLGIHRMARLWTSSDTNADAQEKKSYYKRITTPDDFYIPTTFYTCCESPEQLETLSLVKLFKRLHGLCWLYDASASAEAVQESFNFWSARIFEYLRGRDKSSLPIYVIGTNKGSARPETVELGKAIAESLDAAHFTLAPKDTSSINRTFLNIFSRCFQDAMKRLAESFDLLVDEHNMKAAL